jgi:uncharacterized membrane protein
MQKGRVEAFSDGVFAVIITIMVLEMKIPQGPALRGLVALLPVFLSYVLSFIYVGIYWNNHHHLFQAVKQIKGSVLWANLHLLFWLSLIPFVTAWSGENHFMQWPMALYGFVLFMCGLAYSILVKVLIENHSKDSLLAQAIGRDRKGTISVVLYTVAIIFSFCVPMVSGAIYILVAAIWLVPDRRIEDRLPS